MFIGYNYNSIGLEQVECHVKPVQLLSDYTRTCKACSNSVIFMLGLINTKNLEMCEFNRHVLSGSACLTEMLTFLSHSLGFIEKFS